MPTFDDVMGVARDEFVDGEPFTANTVARGRSWSPVEVDGHLWDAVKRRELDFASHWCRASWTEPTGDGPTVYRFPPLP